MISALNATTYTCPLYASLLSFASALRDETGNKRILCLSYGSGCAASLYGMDLAEIPVHASKVLAELASRPCVAIEDALAHVNAFEMTHGRFGFVPSGSK